MVDEEYGYTVVGQILYSTQLTQWLNMSLGALRVLACINNMIEDVAWKEASCVVSPVLLMCGSVTSVVMTYKHAFLQGIVL